MSAAEIAAWLLPAFARVDLNDALTNHRDSLGTDDMPHLALIERNYTPAFEAAYGAWGAEREVQWDLGRRGDPFDAARVAQRAAEFVDAFVRRNGRVKLVVRGTVANGSPRREMIVEWVQS